MVHVLLKEALELVTDEESLRGVVAVDSLPNQLLLARGAHGLVLWGVQVLWIMQSRAIAIA